MNTENNIEVESLMMNKHIVQMGKTTTPFYNEVAANNPNNNFANREYIFRSANKQAKSAFIFNETIESAINEYLDAIESELDAAAKSLTEEP